MSVETQTIGWLLGLLSIYIFYSGLPTRRSLPRGLKKSQRTKDERSKGKALAFFWASGLGRTALVDFFFGGFMAIFYFSHAAALFFFLASHTGEEGLAFLLGHKKGQQRKGIGWRARGRRP